MINCEDEYKNNIIIDNHCKFWHLLCHIYLFKGKLFNVISLITFVNYPMFGSKLLLLIES